MNKSLSNLGLVLHISSTWHFKFAKIEVDLEYAFLMDAYEVKIKQRYFLILGKSKTNLSIPEI